MLSTLKRSNSAAFDTDMSNRFKVDLHPLYNRPQAMPLCVEVTAVDVPRKSSLSLVILADVSGSMGGYGRLGDLKEGIMQVHKVMRVLGGDVRLKLKIVAFNDQASLIFDKESPTEAELQEVCDGMRADGGTSFRNAITVALDQVVDDEFTHIVFMTDGEDRHFSMEPNNPIWPRLRSFKNGMVHVVGICKDADYKRLKRISEEAYHGTYQQISTDGIRGLMGAAMALMYEIIEAEGRVEVRLAETVLSVKPKLLFRNSVPVRVLIHDLPADASDVKVSLIINDETIDRTLEFQDAELVVDKVCAEEYAADIQATASTQVAGLIASRAYERAVDIVQAAVAKIDSIGAAEVTKVIVDKLQAQLTSINALVEQARQAHLDREAAREAARLAEEVAMRAYSEASTARSMSLDTRSGSRTVSELQHQFANL